LKTAVLFIIFNRPETTKKVFNAIREAQPPKLFISSDGKRKGNKDDDKLINQVREVVSNIDWPCEVYRNYNTENLGCRLSVSSSISWFFKNVEEGIILEDDCLPSQSFFLFCENLLNYYRNSQDVFMISGENSATFEHDYKGDYMLSRYANIWGWATWSYVWEKYDVELISWPNQKNDFKKLFKKNTSKRFWTQTLDLVYLNKINTWDYQLCFLLLNSSKFCVIPKINMVSNIGFGPHATNTNNKNEYIVIPSKEIIFPLDHRVFNSDNVFIDSYYENKFFNANNPISVYIANLIKTIYNLIKRNYK
jgi:hypothetical protein